MSTLKIKVDADIEIPSVPNFIRIRTRKEIVAGFDQSQSIADFTDEELHEIGAKWIEKLIHRANQIRKRTPFV